MAREHAPHLQIGRVMAATLGVVWCGGMLIFPLAILLYWVPGGIEWMTYGAMRPFHAAHPYASAAITTAWAMLFPLADMAVVVAALGVLSGRRPSVGAAIQAAIRLYPAALALDVLQNLVNLAEPWLLVGAQPSWMSYATLGLELAYGLPSAAILLPSLAAAAQEGSGPGAALARSFAVTAGNRLRVAVFASFFLLIQILVIPVLQELVVAFLGAGLAGTWLALLPRTLVFAFASAAQAALYWELARLKDGLAPEDLDKVFG